jgi:type II secretory pathway pseudopilin PulG
MSNVLIGIIGVILFIGLALAGALFLGPRFQESTNNSRASAAVQAVAQVANAANMYRVQEGKTDYVLKAAPVAATDTNDLVVAQYLKSIPSNPSGGAIPSLTVSPGFVTIDLVTNGAAVCDAINKQSGVVSTFSAATPGTTPATASGTQGCYKAATGGAFYAFSAI